MTSGLQEFAKKDAGFRQFNDRYETVSADPETRREYAMWVDEALREEGMLDWARREALEQVVRNMKEDGDSPEKIARNTGLSLSQIAEL